MEPLFERLPYRLKWTQNPIQQTEGTDCFVPFVNLNAEENLVMLKLTAAEYTKMLSALMNGAEISYPDESMQIVVNFLKGIHCPPILADQECKDFPPYSSFIQYLPVSPFVSPDEIPSGYLSQPFLVNGQNGNDIDGYEDGDVIVPFGAITLDVDWLDNIGGQLPQINVVVQGEGTVFLKLLSIGLGGVACITLDNPPNIADIIIGVVTGSDNIIDLNQDLVALPPETAKELIYEVNVVGTGIHTIYITFLPIIDDSATPVRFGGGLRSIQLCDFVAEGTMGLQNIRFLDCNLEQQNADGSWSVVDGWEDWLDCVPSGGGGGATSIIADTNNVNIGSSPTTTATSYTRETVNGAWTRSFTKQNAIIQMTLFGVNSGNNNTFFRPVLRDTLAGTNQNGDNLTEARNNGSTGRTMVVSDVFSGIAAGSHALQIEWKVAAGTGTINGGYDVQWLVIEFDDVSDLFVEDIRISGNELQKKIGGVWITVTDSLAAILSSIQTIANNALSAANSAIATNVAQAASIVAIQAVNTTQNTRLNNLESDVDDLLLSVAQHNLDIASLDSRLDSVESLQSVLAFGGVWAWYHDLTAAAGGYVLGSAGAGWTSGQGWISDSNGLQIIYDPEVLYQNQVTHIQCAVVYASAPTGTSAWKVNGGDRASFRYAGIGNVSYGWYRLPNRANQQLTIEFEGSGNFKLIGLKYLGRGDDIPFD